MSASTITVGYPVHRLETFRRWTNPHGVGFTDWTAACGATDTASGRLSFNRAGSARKAELCPTCFPRRDHYGNFPEPKEIL